MHPGYATRSGGQFKAPWNPTLRVVTVAASALLLGVTVVVARAVSQATMERWTSWLVIALPLGVLLVSALYAVRGYEVARDRLYVKRPLWRTEFALSELIRAWHDPNAMRGSIRLFGNGGLFSFTGLFRNRVLGNYHAYATDDRRAVILVFDRRTILVTPDEPERFLEQLSALRPGTKIGPPPDAS